jgi:hypothetical protein
VIAGGDRMPAPKRAKEPPPETLPLQERIRRRAYELYVERGNQAGSELDDWLQTDDLDLSRCGILRLHLENSGEQTTYA